MQTNKNPSLQQGSEPVQSNASGEKVELDKRPVFTRDGKYWKIVYQTKNHDLIVENAETNNVVYLHKCIDCTVIIREKVALVIVDACEQTVIVVDTVGSTVEFINCQSIQMQVLGSVPSVSIDKTDGFQVYLMSPDSLDVEFVTSKSSEMSVMIPNIAGDFIKNPLPEQYKTTITPNKTLITTIIENEGDLQ